MSLAPHLLVTEPLVGRTAGRDVALGRSRGVRPAEVRGPIVTRTLATDAHGPRVVGLVAVAVIATGRWRGGAASLHVTDGDRAHGATLSLRPSRSTDAL